VLLGQLDGRLGAEHRDARDVQAIRVAAALLDRERFAARDHDAEQPVRLPVPIDYLGERADRERVGLADLGPRADRDDAEAAAVAQHAADHVDIARLEDPQRKPSARKQHGAQRKQGDLHRSPLFATATNGRAYIGPAGTVARRDARAGGYRGAARQRCTGGQGCPPRSDCEAWNAQQSVFTPFPDGSM
jgi:hypothetical protein